MQEHANRELVDLLMEESDPVVRSRAHAELAQRALSSDNLPKAVVHYQEALELDPTDEISRDQLERLTRQKPGGMFSRWNPFRR
ncbi:MAG: hypothetical protein EP330_21260 [Deltaproteobacteria bacterium]|nr:MAG: hypothetical protein EP330_21260 [Deltaproteobacteria bacterium]